MKIVISSIAVIAIVSASIFVGGGHVQHLATIFGSSQPSAVSDSFLFYDPDAIVYGPQPVVEPAQSDNPCGCPSCCSIPQVQ